MTWVLVLKVCIVAIVLTVCFVIAAAIHIAYLNDRERIKRGENVMEDNRE